MAREYSKEEALNNIISFKNDLSQKNLYARKFINYKGCTSDSGEYYQEVYAKYIFENLIDNGILINVEIHQPKNYCSRARNDKAGEKEEKIQRKFYHSKDDLNLKDKYGIPIWYELQVHRNGKGVDLLSYNQNTKILYMFELKYENKTDTLLRTVLEIQTYYQKINWDQAVSDLNNTDELPSSFKDENGKKIFIDNKTIEKIILIDKKSYVYETYKDLEKNPEKYKYLSKLIQLFKIQFEIYELDLNNESNR